MTQAVFLFMLLASQFPSIPASAGSSVPFHVLVPQVPRTSPTLRAGEAGLELNLDERFLDRREVHVLVLTRATGAEEWVLTAQFLAPPMMRSLVIPGSPGRECLLVFLQSEGSGYSLDGPFRWPDRQASRRIEFRQRRTVRGQLRPGEVSLSPLMWLVPDEASPGPPPVCGMVPQTVLWECIGVPEEQSGVVLFSGSGGVTYALAMAGTASQVQVVPTRTAEFGRLVQLSSDEVVDPSVETVDVRALRVVVPRGRPQSIRVDLSVDVRVSVQRVDRRSFWVAGPREAATGLLELSGPSVATNWVALQDFAEGPPDIPAYLTVTAPAVVIGRIVAAGGTPAASARITLFRAIPGTGEIGPLAESSKKALRFAAAETSASDDGRIEIEGLSRNTYEFVALHERYGRAIGLVLPDGGPLVVRLVPPKQISGRVLRKRRPAPRVPVRLVPDLLDLTTSDDPLDYVGGESSTDDRGRFTLALPPRGAGELVIGNAQTGVLRRKLRPPDDLPPLSDVGDIELPEGRQVVALLEEKEACELVATGPIGSAGVALVRATRRSPGVRDSILPEPGRWWLSLDCGTREVTVEPSMLAIGEGTSEITVQLRVLEAAPPPEN